MHQSDVHGKGIQCAGCSGHGLVLDTCGEAEECKDCRGSGRNWQYPSGAIASYYGGPFLGRTTP